MKIKKIKPTIITILGVIIIVLSIGCYFLFDRTLKENSIAMGSTVLIAKQDIKGGCVIKSQQDVMKYFAVKKIQQSNLVKGVVSVPSKKVNGGMIGAAQYGLEVNTIKKLINKKIIKDIPCNQQILISDLSNQTIEFKNDERLFAIPVDFLTSVAGEASVGDHVDIWINKSSNQLQAKTSKKIMGPVQIVKIKDGNNINISKSRNKITNNPSIPKAVVIKANESQIKALSIEMQKGKLFLTKIQK